MSSHDPHFAADGLEGLAAAGVPQPYGRPDHFDVRSPGAAAVEAKTAALPGRRAAAPPLPRTPAETVGLVRDAWRHHGGKAVLAGVLVLASTAAVIAFAPKKYRSEAQLFIRPGRESVTLDPTAATGETLNVAATREAEINSVLEILGSRANLDAVVDRLSPEVVLGDEPLPEDAAMLASLGSPRMTFKPTGVMSEAHTKAVKALEKNVGLEAVRRSNVIEASCVAPDPALAQTLLTAFLDAAVERHMRASRSSGTLDFFKRQHEDVTRQYADASAELSDLKSSVGVTSLEERRKTLQEQLSDAEGAIAKTRADLAEANAGVRGLSEAMSELPPKVLSTTTTGQPQDARGVAETRRSTLRIERTKLLSNYRESHPKVAEIDEQLAEIERLLAGDTGPGQEVEATNPAWLALETDRAQEKARIAALEGKLEAEEDQLAAARSRLTELNGSESRIAGLEEQVKVLRTTAGDYTKKLEQARIDRALEDERLSNITVTQPPTYEGKAVWPQRRLLAAAGLVLAAALGLGLMLGRELWDRAVPAAA